MNSKALWLVFLLLVITIAPVWDEDVWMSSLHKITSMTQFIEADHFSDADYEQMTYASIRGMLQTLDPHSYLLEPKDFARMSEDYRGKYSGLGISIQKYEDRLVVVSPIEGGPGQRVGLRAGDIISHIEGESTKDITSQQAVEKLRGLKGTKVTITIKREGLDEPFDVTIIREEIPLYSVPYAFMLEDGIGYIFIRNFGQTTTEEFRDKVRLLQEEGMKKLILDMRGNGGGTFVQSVEISDEFLPRGELIVSIRGRRDQFNSEFRADLNNQEEGLPLIVLINQGSASAPEIVAGAIKDNDRGLIVGEESWGKGLVQTLFPLASDTAVAITTAKYYTPSGRSIQRDYTEVDDYWRGKEVPEEKREVRFTEGGRKVLGQGGITPDYIVPFSYEDITAMLILKGTFFSYGNRFAERKTELSRSYIFPDESRGDPVPGDGKRRLDKTFRADDRVLADYKAFLKDSGIEFDEKDFDGAVKEIKREIEREIFSSFWGIEEGIRIFRLNDPVVRKAIEVLPEAETLLK